VIALVCERGMPTTEIWRALYGAAVLHRAAGKYVIAVNDDIDPENAQSLCHPLSSRPLNGRVNPHKASREPSEESRRPASRPCTLGRYCVILCVEVHTWQPTFRLSPS
jgi:hypothetical protein